MRRGYIKFVSKNKYIFSVILNILVYGAIYKFISFEWTVVVGIAHINTDIDFTNILLFGLNKDKNA